MEYTTDKELEQMILSNPKVESLLIQNTRFAQIFSFLSFTFTVSLLFLLISFLLNLPILPKLLGMFFLIISLFGGIAINWMDKRLLRRTAEQNLKGMLESKAVK